MKKIIALSLALVFVLAFTSCLDLDKNNGETTQDASAATDGESTSAQDNSTAAGTEVTDENGSTAAGGDTTGDNGTEKPAVTTERVTVTPEQVGGSKSYAALASGKFYMACTAEDEDGTKRPIVFASNGSNFRMDVTVKGSKIGFIIKDGKMYMIYDSTYAEISESFLKQMGVGSVEEFMNSMGVSDNFASEMFGGLTFKKAESGTYSGKNVTKYYYNDASSGSTILYETADGTLLAVENLDSSGKTTQTMVFDDFSIEIPADVFDLSKYTETDFMTLLLSMYSVLEDQL